MVQSAAKTPDEYLDELPEDRREVVSTLRKLIRKNLPKGYTEMMAYGMLMYGIPLKDYPHTYNGQPLGYIALAAQKNAYSLYVFTYMDHEQDAALRDGFAAAGKKLDMGKSCIRFKKLDDLPLDVIGNVVASTPPEKLIGIHEAVHPPKPAKKKKA